MSSGDAHPARWKELEVEALTLTPSESEPMDSSLSPSPNAPAELQPNQIYQGDARELLKHIEPNSIPLSIWSPPYFVGKSYEQHMTYEEWKSLLEEVICLHYPIIRHGGFVAINIADILCFRDPTMPRVQADSIDRKRSPVTREDVLEAMARYPHLNRYQLAELLGCSEQTIDRRLKGNNIRGGKYAPQTRVHLVGGLIEEWCSKAGFYLYDRRIWIKDPAWENNPWFTLSYRSIDEFEYIYILWKPGVTKVRRSRLSSQEWSEWGSRAVWQFPSVRKNEVHEAQFPVELPRRLIKLLSEPGEVILDCFIGSGTTAIAALMEERQFIGIELLPEYVNLARQRVEQYKTNRQPTLCF